MAAVEWGDDMPYETFNPPEVILPGDTTEQTQDWQSLYNTLTQFQQAHQAMMQEYVDNRSMSGEKQAGGHASLREQANKQVFQRYLPQFEELKNQMQQYGMNFYWNPDYGNTVAFDLPGTGGATGLRVDDFGDVFGYVSGQVQSISDQESRQQQWTTFLDQFADWAAQREYGKVQVDPFADENGWSQMVSDVFGELGEMPDMQSLLESLYDVMPTWNYTADALPNLSAQERMTEFFNDLKASGFRMAEYGSDPGESLRHFLYNKAQELAPKNMFAQLGIDRSEWSNMTNGQISELMNVIGRKSVLEDSELRQYVDSHMRSIRRVNMEEYNSKLAMLAAKGVGYGGAVIRSAQDLQVRLAEAEMTAASDIFMRGIELAEQAKPAAMQTLASLSATDAELIMEIGQLKTTLFGQYFSFLGNIGQVEAANYATNTERYMTESTLQLKYSLGVAGLEMEQYISDRGLDIDTLKLDYENYWRDRGADLEEKGKQFDAAIVKWQTSAMMTEMINGGRVERLVQMASLALKAQGNDIEAKHMYETLALQERLEQRGMDNEQSFALADLQWNYFELGENMDLQRWAAEHNALLQKELLRMGIEGEKELMQYQEELRDDGFWGSVLKFVGGAAKLATVLFTGGSTKTGDTGGDTGKE